MVQPYLLLALFWIVYCLLHSLFASTRFKQKAKLWLKSSYIYYRVYYTLFAFITFVAILYYQIQLREKQLWEGITALEVIGGFITISGLAIMLVCIRKYFFSLSGLKSLFTGNASNTLIISGIHKYMRHPLYFGTFVFIWGLLLLFPYVSLLIANTIITVYTLIGIHLEEEKLVEEFGDQYQSYRKTVPMLLPSLKKDKVNKSIF